jgi:hypothetical protein
VNATLEAGHPQSAFWTSGFMIGAYIAGLLAVICFVGAMRQWSLPLTGDRPHRRAAADPGAPRTPAVLAGPAMTHWWRAATDDVSTGLLQLQNNTISHPAYMSRSPQENPPPSVRIGMMVACSPLDPLTPPTSEIRAKLLAFLGQPPLIDLVRSLTDVREGLAWRAWDDNPRFNFGAILSPPDSDEAPVAWARLLVPEKATRRYGRDPRCANLVLYVEPRTRPASLVTWYERFAQSLRVPATLVTFLRQQLGLSTSSDPLAEAGVWLRAPQALTELVDIDGFESVPGSPHTNGFMGFAMADPDGQPVADMAGAWLQQMCDSSLHLDDREAVLPNLRTESAGDNRLVVQASMPIWESWRQLAYIVAIRVDLTNTTNGVIRLGAVNLFGGFWGPDPPADRLRLDDSEARDLWQEIENLRSHRYSPDLSDRTTILPHETISGWVVTNAPRPSSGAIPTLELTIAEAVGYQYRVVIHPAKPHVKHALADTSKDDRPDGVLDGPTARPNDTDSEPG